MGISTYTPLFRITGFGPLGLPTDPAAYGVSSALIASASPPSPSGSSSASVFAGAVEPASLGSPVSRATGGLWAAGRDSKPGSVPPSATPGSGGSRIDASYSLKFASGRLRGSEIALSAERPLIIGRTKGLEIVLDEANVSGRHAKISLSGHEVTIEDLGSTGGTYVNGTKLKKEQVLKENDRVMIGSSMFSLIVARGTSPVVDSAKPTETQRPSAYLMRGTITDMPLPDLLQLFEGSRKSGVLRMRGNVKGEALSEGEIHLREGRVIFASVDGREHVDPRKSFYRIVTWQEGEFELVSPVVRDFPMEIEESIQGLLMEGFRIMDELGNLGPDRPPLTASVAASLSLERPLRGLSPEELDVIQSVLMGGTVQDVLDRAPGDDILTTKTLTELIRKGYVQITS